MRRNLCILLCCTILTGVVGCSKSGINNDTSSNNLDQIENKQEFEDENNTSNDNVDSRVYDLSIKDNWYEYARGNFNGKIVKFEGEVKKVYSSDLGTTCYHISKSDNDGNTECYCTIEDITNMLGLQEGDYIKVNKGIVFGTVALKEYESLDYIPYNITVIDIE